MHFATRTLFTSRRFQVAATAVFACVSTVALQAQDATLPVQNAPAPSVSAAPAKMDLTVPKLDLTGTSGVGYSSSVSQDADAVETAALDFKLLPEDASQPPPRRRYGRPRYNDSSHNPDGSNKYGFLAGVGLTQPVGNTLHYYQPKYSFQVGAGRNFNKNFSTFLQFDYDAMGLEGSTIGNQSLLYFGATGQGLDGNAHIWSFTVDPTYNIYAREGLGAYVVAGVGFYHKVTNFTLPETGLESVGFEVFEVTENENIDHYTSNAVGFNGGLGLTFKPSRFANEKLFIEARYVFVDNQQRPGVTIFNEASASPTATNLFPANSNRTTYIPIKVGIRF